MKKIFVVSMVFVLCAPGASVFASKDFGISFAFNLLNMLQVEAPSVGTTLSASYLFLGSDTTPLRAGLGLSRYRGYYPFYDSYDAGLGSFSLIAAYATAQFYPHRVHDTSDSRFYLKGSAGLYTCPDPDWTAGWQPYYALGIGSDFGKIAFWECVFSFYLYKDWGSWTRLWTLSILTFGFRI
jgi:hypothetical protein